MPWSVLKAKRAADSVTQEVRCKHLDAQPKEDFLGPRGQLGRLQTADGHLACCYYWPAPAPKGVVILVHGQGSYLTHEYLSFTGVCKPKLYTNSWVEAFNQAGYSVAGLDNRGCGRSAGLFGYINSWKELVHDVVTFSQKLQHIDVPGFAGLPVFLLGTSLGGCIALHAALQQPKLYQGLILMAPMISLQKIKSKGLNPILLKVAALLNRFIPTWPLCKTSTNEMFPELQEDFDADPVTYHHDTRVRVGIECIAACDAALSSMSQLVVPLLVVHSLSDDMTDPDGSKLLHKQAKTPDKTLRLLTNGMWHVLTKEEGNMQLLQENIAWIDSRCGSCAIEQ